MPLPGRASTALLALALVNGCARNDRPTARRNVPQASHPAFAQAAIRGGRTHPTRMAVTAVRRGGRPFGIAVSREGVVYSTLLDSARLVRTTLQADSLTLIVVGSVPTDVAFSPAGTWAYVTNQFAQAVGVIDTRMNQQVATVPVEGDPFRVAVGPEGQRVYATTNRGNVVQIEADSRAVGWTIQLGGNLNGLAINSADERVYVGDVRGAVYELTPGGEMIRTIPVPGNPQGLALSSDGRELYAAGEGGDLIAVDLETGLEKARTRLGAGGFGIAVSPDQEQIWVTAPAAGEIFVLDRVSLKIVATVVVRGTPRRIAFDSSGTTAVIANEAGSIGLVR